MWTQLAIAAAILAAGFGGGWEVNGWRLNGDLADMKTKVAETRAVGAEGALKDLTTATAGIKAAADQYTGIQNTLGSQIAQLRKDLKNAPAPLPVDCKPDDFRVRKLDNAIDAANQARAR